MINFRNIRYRNFLAAGDTSIEISLDQSGTTLIVGQNGAGKSTMAESLSFALFGKPYRAINKAQLINSINKKNCEVELDFDIGTHRFKIIRGMKPNKFEIYQNGNMINQDAAVKDYQKYLEQNILKLNHKSFHQIVVLGSSSFVPFMQLSAANRREVIEDLLDINIFSQMNLILKEKLAKIKEDLTNVNQSLMLNNERIDIQKKYIDDISRMNEDHSKEKKQQIQNARDEIKILEEANDEMNRWFINNDGIYESLLEKEESKYEQLLSYNAQFSTKVAALVKETKFFENNDECPTCSQSIDPHLKEEKLNTGKAKAKELKVALDKTVEEMASIKESIDQTKGVLSTAAEWRREMSSNNKRIASLQSAIDNIETELLAKIDSNSDISKAKEQLDFLISDKDELLNRKSELNTQRTYHEVSAEMLKDTGIKTKVVKEYLPVMNKLINQYLAVMDFFVSFHLDENFNESIKSRHRDDFKYASFSEGEKMRIDLALLMAWRQIAKMKNSASTNLLILDETGDSSLDGDGMAAIFQILNTLENTNIFMISHKADISDHKFGRKLEFTKPNNFSKCKEISGL